MDHDCPRCAANSSATKYVSVAADHLDSLQKSAVNALAARVPATAQAASQVQTYFHFDQEGRVLAAATSAVGGEGDTTIRGNLGPFPFELHVHLQLQNDVIQLTLELSKPIHVGPYTWQFKLHGLTRDAQGQIVGATSVEVDPDFDPSIVDAQGLNWWCVLKCGGLQILPTLALCLPTLAGGPAAYVACVVAKVGAADAAGIAKCVAEKCT
jgi:hypothetical protein